MGYELKKTQTNEWRLLGFGQHNKSIYSEPSLRAFVETKDKTNWREREFQQFEIFQIAIKMIENNEEGVVKKT